MWGINALPVPDDAKIVWGARAIQDPGPRFSLLYDRQSWRGGPPEKRAQLVVYLNEIMKVAQLKYARFVMEDDIRRDTSNLVILYEDKCIKMIGNTNASHGYFYVAAWLK